MSDAHAHNRQAWDRMAHKKQRFTRPAGDDDFVDPLKRIDAAGWLGDIRGRRVLCLAAGGGRQGPLYAAAGANVTIVDISPAMLQLDRDVAAERRLDLRTIETSMDDLSMIQSAEFEIVVHPVSTCYVADALPVFREVARVLQSGGLYISQHKAPTSLQAAIDNSAHGYELVEPYYREGPLPPVAGSRLREAGTNEYLHRWEVLIGGMCRAGFVIEDLIEPLHAKKDARPGEFAHRARYIAPYVRVKARRSGQVAGPPRDKSIWMP